MKNEELKKKNKFVNSKNPNPTPNRETPPPRTSLHDDQAIEPSVLKKLDELEKQLAITDKAFDLICKEHTEHIIQKEKLRNYYLKKAKEESEKENAHNI